MKLFVLVHANMALPDNWPHAPERGRAYYQSVLDYTDYDIGLALFLDPYGNDHRDEQAAFVEQCKAKFDVAEWEEDIGEVLDRIMDEVLLENEITEIVFAGGYATDCLPRSIAFFLSRFGTYCMDQNIEWTLEPSLVYDGPRMCTMDEDQDVVDAFCVELEHFNRIYFYD